MGRNHISATIVTGLSQVVSKSIWGNTLAINHTNATIVTRVSHKIVFSKPIWGLSPVKDHNKAVYQCSHCDKAFSHNGQHISHLRTHIGEKPLKPYIFSQSGADWPFGARGSPLGLLAWWSLWADFIGRWACGPLDYRFWAGVLIKFPFKFETPVHPCSQCEKLTCIIVSFYFIWGHTGKKP